MEPVSRLWTVEGSFDDWQDDIYLVQPDYYLESKQGNDRRAFMLLNGAAVSEEVMQQLGENLNFNIALRYDEAVAYVREWPITKEWGVDRREGLELDQAAVDEAAELALAQLVPQDENKFDPLPLYEGPPGGPVIRVLAHANGEVVNYMDVDGGYAGNLEAFTNLEEEHERLFGAFR